MVFEAIRKHYSESPELTRSQLLTGEVLSRCEMILSGLDTLRNDQLDKSVTELSSVSLPIEIVDKDENTDVGGKTVDILLSGKSLNDYLPPGITFVVHPDKPLAYSNSSKVIYIPETMTYNCSNLHFLIVLSHEIGHSLTEGETRKFSDEEMNEELESHYREFKRQLSLSSIQDKLRVLGLLYKASSGYGFRARISSVNGFINGGNLSLAHRVFHMIKSLGGDWESLHDSYSTSMNDVRESEIIFSETIAWKKAFGILQELDKYEHYQAMILDCAEGYLGGYLLRNNRFKDFSRSKLSVQALRRNMEQGNFSFE